MESIKNYQIYLFSFILVNALFLGLDSLSLLKIEEFNFQMIKQLLLLPSISLVVSIIFNGILSSEMKDRIVFLRWKNPLPGSRLKKIIGNDSRFNVSQLEEKFGPIPDDPKMQNIYWYQELYKNNQEVEKIKDVHRMFLMTRDMTSIVIIVLIISVINVVFYNGSIFQVFIILCEYLLLRQVCSNYGKRFVSTVVAEAI